MESVENSNNDPQVSAFNPASVFSPQVLVKQPVKDETYRRVEKLGANAFGKNFAGAHEMIMSERTIFVINPEEFFFSEEGLNGKLTEQQEKTKRDFLIAQDNFYMDFYRKNMAVFSVDGIVSTLKNMKGEIDPEVLKTSLSLSVKEALEGKTPLFRKDI